MDGTPGNLFESLPIESSEVEPNDVNSSEEIFSSLARGDGMHIERIVSRGHTSPVAGWYDQSENEWVTVLKGEAVISFIDGSHVRLGPGDFIDIPAHQKHRVSWTLPDGETVWLAVHYRPARTTGTSL